VKNRDRSHFYRKKSYGFPIANFGNDREVKSLCYRAIELLTIDFHRGIFSSRVSLIKLGGVI